jgi:hypothetical protein
MPTTNDKSTKIHSFTAAATRPAKFSIIDVEEIDYTTSIEPRPVKPRDSFTLPSSYLPNSLFYSQLRDCEPRNPVNYVLLSALEELGSICHFYYVA